MSVAPGGCALQGSLISQAAAITITMVCPKAHLGSSVTAALMCSLGCGTSLNQKNQVQGSLTLSVRQSVAHVLVPFHQFPALNKHVVKS